LILPVRGATAAENDADVMARILAVNNIVVWY